LTTTETQVAAGVGVPDGPLALAEGVELLGPVQGSGYREGAALVRRGDGQMVQLGPLAYALLECVDGERVNADVAERISSLLGRRLEEGHVLRLAEKMAAQGLLSGTEQAAPPRRNPLLALRWKVLVTNPAVTRRITAPFAMLFRPWIMWSVVAAFVAVCWFVLVDKGVAGATAQAFHSPGLLLLVFALAVVSAGFHELGHASSCAYGGATPGGMGMGLYLVWPAFYTDVTDSYRLDRRSRLRVDLAGLYFNAVVAVVTMGVWLIVRTDSLLLLVALQVLQMVKQLSPMMRADGYHILSDLTGVPDLFAHMGPTVRRVLPGHRREPSALTGRARLLVTVWVMVMVPVLMSLMLSAVVLLPRLAATAWASGRHLVVLLPHQVAHGQLVDALASLVQLLALALPVAGSALVTQKSVRTVVPSALKWSDGHPVRRGGVFFAGVAIVAGLAYAWWPSNQYRAISPHDKGTIGSLIDVIKSPLATIRPGPEVEPPSLPAGRYLALAMIPTGGITAQHPALFVLPGGKGRPPVAVVETDPAPSPAPSTAAGAPSGGNVGTGGTTISPEQTRVVDGKGGGRTTITSGGATRGPTTVEAAAFPFTLPSQPGPLGTQAEALNTTNGGVTYNVAYAVVTVSGGAPVTETNSAYAIAACQSCTTVAVSYQVVLVVGQSNVIDPIDAAVAFNDNCPACTTTAIADQMVLTLRSQPTAAEQQRLDAILQQLDLLPELGANGTPVMVASLVGTVQQEVEAALAQTGLVEAPGGAAAGTAPSTPTTSTTVISSGGVAATSGTTTGNDTTSPSPPGSTATVGSSSSGGYPPATTPTPPSTSDPAATSPDTSASEQTSPSSGGGTAGGAATSPTT
jgi:putative peptide zinc metalloprotease protein